MFTTGQTITVNDPNSFYRGRTAIVLSINTWGERGTFLYVRVESGTGNGWIGFNLRAEHAVASMKEPVTEPTPQGNQFVIPGCERDKSRGPAQMDLF